MLAPPKSIRHKSPINLGYSVWQPYSGKPLDATELFVATFTMLSVAEQSILPPQDILFQLI